MAEASVEYTTRAAARRETAAALLQREIRISQVRLLVFTFGVVHAWLAWQGSLSPWTLIAPVAAFTAFVVAHDRTIRARGAAERAVAFYERGLARLEDRWVGTGETGDRFRSDEHLYANDLDLFGRGSLFELLSIARTQGGEEALARWLTHPADTADINARHDAIRELTPALDLREALALAGDDVRAGVHTSTLVAWARAPRALAPLYLRWVAVALTIATVAGLILVAATGQYIPLLIAAAVQGAFRARQRTRVDAVLHGASAAARELAILLDVVQRLEGEPFASPLLSSLKARITSSGGRASTSIRALRRLAEAHDWEHNLIFTIIAAALMWGTHIAWTIERWRERHGSDVAMWLDTVGEFEALSSLSAYRYEHPDDPFPELVESVALPGGRPDAHFEGLGLGHPLLHAESMIRNDVTLSADTRLLVISGSNMSGKSTLLRTVGINTVLALAGAPVRARSLRLSPMAIGATLRIQDSLQEGRSRFYAEITRIRHIVDLARGPRPVLFLLDELFHGTNSHDRLVGATGVLRTLLDLGAVGLITTHDLALTAAADELAPRAVNVHFEDHFEGGDIQFDYRMKPGPVTRSNAIALMRAVGLEV